MATEPPEARLAPRRQVTFRPIPSGAMLVDIETGACFQLNQVGAAFWNSLSQGATVRAAITKLQQLYDADAETIEKDSLRLCADLLRAGLVEPRPDGDLP